MKLRSNTALLLGGTRPSYAELPAVRLHPKMESVSLPSQFASCGLIADSAGNFYGTTNGGGAAGAGVVFKIDSSGDETVLYGFTGGADGGYPLWVTLARDSAGNLYGTTQAGGTASQGVVFKIDKSGNESVLHTFTGGADGGSPYAGVTLGPEEQNQTTVKLRRWELAGAHSGEIRG